MAEVNDVIYMSILKIVVTCMINIETYVTQVTLALILKQSHRAKILFH